jgi:methyl-accepting chemotaxis protein
MEELQATQEESSRKSAEMEGLIEALNTSSYVIEYDLDGYIQNVNDNYLNLMGLSKDEVLGTHHSLNMEFSEKQKAEYDKFWKDLRTGNVKKETTKVKVNNKELVFAETYTPIRNAEGEVFKILKISNNITDFKEQK